MKLIDNALFEDLCEKADESPRRRAHHLIHDSQGEPVQRMLIALQPGTYFRPHRHRLPPKWELVLVLKGIAAWIGFDEVAASAVEPKRGRPSALVYPSLFGQEETCPKPVLGPAEDRTRPTPGTQVRGAPKGRFEMAMTFSSG